MAPSLIPAEETGSLKLMKTKKEKTWNKSILTVLREENNNSAKS
jgi:hypothetical protein